MALDISSKRFSVKSDGFGGFTLRDRDAPYHPHSVSGSDMPEAAALSSMTEREFDRLMTRLCYEGKA